MTTTETAMSVPQTAKAQIPHRVTIGNVAELAGVSTATVSNVINNTGSVSEATKQRVRAVIQRTKWTPNVDARNLARSAAEKPRPDEME
jgi:plasmid maintenance system antidote protein VapI